jgi:hypothetical protein
MAPTNIQNAAEDAHNHRPVWYLPNFQAGSWARARALLRHTIASGLSSLLHHQYIVLFAL